MPLTMKIQPVDSTSPERFESVKAGPKSRLRRLFDFSSFLKGSAIGDRTGESQCGKELLDDFEPSSVCLDKMVQSFIEDSNEKLTGATKCGRQNHHQCNCTAGSCNCSTDCSEDEFDSFNCFGNSYSSSTDACDPLKSLVLCETVSERNLLADAAKIVDKNKICKKKDETSLKIIADGLLATGYNTVSICKSRWEKTSTYPAGEYEYIDAIIDADRLIIDVDFRSEFEIARSTKSYKAVLQTLPHIFVGKADRLQKIINIVSDAARQSLRKKGMPLPPWRRADYVKSKWLSPTNNPTDGTKNQSFSEIAIRSNPISQKAPILIDEIEGTRAADEEQLQEGQEGVKEWKPPLEIKPKAVAKSGAKVISGLASVIEGK